MSVETLHNPSSTTISSVEQAALRAQHEPLHDFIPAGALLNTLRIQLTGRDAYTQLLASSNPEVELVDFSPEAIRANALAVAVETLPEDVVTALELPRAIEDNVSYNQPPTLESTLLIGEAWDQLRKKPTPVTRLLQRIGIHPPTTSDPLEGAFAASIDELGERTSPGLRRKMDLENRDLIGAAYKIARSTGMNFTESYTQELAKREMSDDEMLERLEIREEANRIKEKQLQAKSAEELEILRNEDVAVKVDMSQFFDD